MKKLLTRLFIAMLILTFTPTMNTQAKAKIKLNKTKISLQRGKTYTLKVKGTKKKVKWSSNKKTIATVTRKGKVTAQKPGTAVITAKIGKKKYKCKVKVWQKTTKKPTKTNTEPNPIGTRVNPADPRIGITLDITGGTVYFKLTETLKGQEAENRLLQMNQSLEEIKQGEYEHTGTTLVLFVYDVQAVNGFAAYPLNGLDIINSYTLYDRTCSKNIKNIEICSLMIGLIGTDRENIEVNEIKQHRKDEVIRLYDSLDERKQRLILVHIRALAGKN